jgi:hypothetical protein
VPATTEDLDRWPGAECHWHLAGHPHLHLKASLGLNYHDLNASLMRAGSEMPTRFSANDTSFSAGLGIGVPINDHFELGLDLSQYRQLAPDFTFEEEIGQVYETDATVLSLGARFRF